jgi:esterase/lipase
LRNQGNTKKSNLILHPHLKDPERYASLLEGENDSLNQFLLMAQEEGLITVAEDTLLFSPKLLEKFKFDTIRIKNTPKVIYNEVKPIRQLGKIVERVADKFNKYKNERLPEYFFDDDLTTYYHDEEKFSGSDYKDINQRETKILSGEPFFLKSRGVKGRKIGVLLIHGFSASPSEMKPLGEFLHDHGYTVYGVRLKGHGTSPHDLDQTPWEKSIESIEQGYKVLSLWCRDVVVVGFSVGAVIALDLASQSRDNIRGVVSISASIEVEGMDNLALIFSAQMEKLVRLIPGVKSKFIEWDTQSPQVNYRSVPLQKLADLKNYIEKVKKRLKAVSIPLLIIQANCDPIIKRRSAEFIFEKVLSEEKKICWHDSDKHNVVNENCVAVYNNILSFIRKLK